MQWYLSEIIWNLRYINTFSCALWGYDGNQCNTCLCQMYDMRAYSETATACSSQQTKASGRTVLWCPGKTKSQARGLGCCLALLSTVFNMIEHNSDSDHIDRKLLTMSGEKVICQLFHCGVFCMTATHAMEWKLQQKVFQESHLSFNCCSQKNPTYKWQYKKE